MTLDEGDSFTEHSVQFRPDTLRFQYSRIPNVNDAYVLGYDTGNRSVSHVTLSRFMNGHMTKNRYVSFILKECIVLKR